MLRDFPKDYRYTLGSKIDSLFVDVSESLFLAASLGREQKLSFLRRASIKLDLLRFFLHVAWNGKAISTKRYVRLSEKIDEIGRMLGGWRKQVAGKENPA